MSPAEIVQGQLDAYNAQNMDAFMAFYAPNAALANLNGDTLAEGAEAIRARYAKVFADFPQNHARLVNRVAVGATVIDHEDVSRAPGGERFEVAAIYTIKNGLIARVDFAK